jgi:pimeloyl-ACP methyl ester carboxylesterase
MLSRFIAALLICFTLTATAGKANEVTVAHQGMTLNAGLELAAGRTVADGAILITHGALAHRDMETLTYFRQLLKEQGYNTLAINLSLGLDNRHGMYDCKVSSRHRNEDSLEEITAWLDWLRDQGAKRVTLLGHSRGGAQTALHAATRDSDLVDTVVLLAPATADNTSAEAYRKRYNRALPPLLERAHQLVATGHGDTVIDGIGLMSCPDTSATAESLLSYYGPRAQAQVDTPGLLPRIKKPTLVVVAGDDRIVVGLDKKLAPLVDGKQLQMAVVATADHMFRDLYADDAVAAIDGFLKSVKR